MKPRDVLRSVCIRYQGEEGVDAGGLLKDACTALFERLASDSAARLGVNHTSAAAASSSGGGSRSGNGGCDDFCSALLESAAAYDAGGAGGGSGGGAQRALLPRPFNAGEAEGTPGGGSGGFLGGLLGSRGAAAKESHGGAAAEESRAQDRVEARRRAHLRQLEALGRVLLKVSRH